MVTNDELYEGFSKEQIERWEREVDERYDPELVEESRRRVRRMTKDQWKAVQDEGNSVTVALAALMDKEVSSAEVQVQVARHHAWIERFYPASAEVYRGLGEGYAANPEFRAFYEKVRPGLADFLRDAMGYYAQHTLSGRGNPGRKPA